ncbi:MAG: SCO family protein [Actinomycetota bacterium]|nr:SCO family protein [Actinomycetota bacterium]
MADHGAERSAELHIPRWAKVLVAVLLVLAVSAMAFAVFQPITVLPRIRLSPGYALADQTGSLVTSEDGRGVVTLYSFVPLNCGDTCEEVLSTMREVGERVDDEVDLGDVDFRRVTIVLDADPSTEAVARAASAAGAGVGADTSDWLWLTGSAADVTNVAGLGFEQPTDPGAYRAGYVIVDGAGTIRGDYRYRTLTDDADKLVDHLDVLGKEIRQATGIAAFGYEAAHVFACYP